MAFPRSLRRLLLAASLLVITRVALAGPKARTAPIAPVVPAAVLEAFARWIEQHGKRRPFFISDNNGFDWQFVNWYFWHFLGRNPFGHSSTNLGSRPVTSNAFKISGRPSSN